MTTTPVGNAEADITTGDRQFDTYTAAFERGEAPLLGHLVLYTVCESDVTPEDLEGWFRELALDLQFVPGRLRAVDAFEKVTGPNGVKHSYPLDDPLMVQDHRREKNERGQKAHLMVRHVSREDVEIVRHVVREVRDAGEKRLAYDSQLATCRFVPDRDGKAEPGAGRMEVRANEDAIRDLPEDEQTVVRSMLFAIEEQYRLRCTYVSADKLRTVVRKYLESLHGIKVRQGGGVYFVHREHAETLAALRTLVSRWDGGSQLNRIPLPDQEEMRELIEASVTTKAKEDLEKLAGEIAKAQRAGTGGPSVEALHKRFLALKAETAKHTELLSMSLGDTEAALELVNRQLVSLLTTVTDE